MTITLLGTGKGLGTGTGGGGGATLPPSSLTGLIGWWDTSVFASLSLSSGNCTQILDQSGSGNRLDTAGGRSQPYSATGFNTSYPGITTTSGNGFFETAGATPFPMGTSNTLTAFYVGTLGTGGSRIMSYAAPGTNDHNTASSWTIANSTPWTSCVIQRNSINIASPTGSAAPAGHRIIATINSSGVMTVYLDGVAGSTTTSSGNWATNGAFDLMRQASHDSDFWYGTIAEAGVATGFTNSTDVAALDLYLKNKWGL